MEQTPPPNDPLRDPDVSSLSEAPNRPLDVAESAPLPEETVPDRPPDIAPPLPEETIPDRPPDEVDPEDDGWDALWDSSASQYYFYNRFTQVTTWDNPRVPSPKQPQTLAEKLAQDVEFQNLSRSEKIKRYEEEQAKLNQPEEESPAIDVNEKKHAQLLASAFGDSTGRLKDNKHRVTKEDMKQYKKQKKDKKEKKLREWLMD